MICIPFDEFANITEMDRKPDMMSYRTGLINQISQSVRVSQEAKEKSLGEEARRSKYFQKIQERLATKEHKQKVEGQETIRNVWANQVKGREEGE